MRLRCANDHDLTGKNLPVDDVGIEYCPICGTENIYDVDNCQHCGYEYRLDEYEEAFEGCCRSCFDRAKEQLVDYLKEQKEMSPWARSVMIDAMPHLELDEY